MKYFFRLILFLFLLVACSPPLDFKQAEDFTATPVYTLDVFHMELNPSKFTDTVAGPVTQILDTVPMNIFVDDFLAKGLQKIDVYVKYENPWPASFKLTMKLLDKQNAGITSMTDTILPGNASNPWRHESLHTINLTDVPDLPRIKNLALQLERLDTNDLSQATGLLKIQSKADIYYVFE